jgi:hypothetical protein
MRTGGWWGFPVITFILGRIGSARALFLFLFDDPLDGLGQQFADDLDSNGRRTVRLLLKHTGDVEFPASSIPWMDILVGSVDRYEWRE